MRTSSWLLVVFGLLSTTGHAVNHAARSTHAERAEVRERIRDFYATPADDAELGREMMSRRTPKYDAETGLPVTLNQHLRWAEAGNDPLAQRAQIKASDAYRKFLCETFYKKHFPHLRCDMPASQEEGRATIEGNDRIESLVATFLRPEQIVRTLADLPVEGETQVGLWSDDYWRLQWGATAYRYGEGKEFDSYDQAVADYEQPGEWASLVEQFAITKLTKKILKWSPAEKYDLTVGDEKFTMTRQQKEHPGDYKGKDGDVEPWMGICHGWAAAAITVPRAERAVVMTGARGVQVTWNPHDIRAIASLAWANGQYRTNNVGGRCNSKKAATYKNGRLSQQDCFDTNPATFHLALGNLIGKLGHSFVMDKDFDYEVWNQPVQSYAVEYFNPLDPDVTTKDFGRDWEKVAVAYADFKASGKDRFQKPLTRGRRVGSRNDDSQIDYVVGVTTTVSYLVEVDPRYGARPAKDSFARETYTYDLELQDVGGELVPTGGEWHTNVHPDFLWVPQQGAVALHPIDRVAVGVSPSAAPSARLTQAATRASGAGYPLCGVVKALVDNSAPAAYRCGL